MKLNTLLILSMIFLLVACEKDEPEAITSVTDIDGNVYPVVTIGEQVWSAENFKSTKLNDGTPIQFYAFDPNDDEDWFWNSRTTPMYVLPSTDFLSTFSDDDFPEDFFGYHYSRGAVDSGKLAPEGWRIPTNADYEALLTYLRTTAYADDISSALRSTEYWFGDDNGTNALGLNLMPNGYCRTTGSSSGAHASGTYNSADAAGDEHYLFNISPTLEGSLALNDSRFSGGIRLIKE